MVAVGMPAPILTMSWSGLRNAEEGIWDTRWHGDAAMVRREHHGDAVGRQPPPRSGYCQIAQIPKYAADYARRCIAEHQQRSIVGTQDERQVIVDGTHPSEDPADPLPHPLVIWQVKREVAKAVILGAHRSGVVLVADGRAGLGVGRCLRFPGD